MVKRKDIKRDSSNIFVPPRCLAREQIEKNRHGFMLRSVRFNEIQRINSHIKGD